MLRLRCSFVPQTATAAVMEFQWTSTSSAFVSRRAFGRGGASSALFRRMQYAPHTLAVPVTLSSTTAASLTASSLSYDLSLRDCKRYFRARSQTSDGSATSESSSTGATNAEQAKTDTEEGSSNKDSTKTNTDSDTKEKKTEGGEAEEKEPQGIRGFVEGLKKDFVEFPDIYNSANAINFILFTVFCLCSTGSNVEGEWWLDQFGIDAAFRPLAWFFHSFVMNNFLSMTFAMMLLHTMCHSVLPTIGSHGLFMYCAIISVAAGVMMWGANYAAGYTKEKQFGPWDIVSGLFVMQFLHQGFKPWQILNSFNGWVRYACWLGAVCIVYYDFQPVVLGTALGFALCRVHPKFRVSKPAA